MTLEEGIKIYEEQYPDHMVASVLDLGDEWVFAAKDRETGLERDASPIAVHKENGSMRVFFPPFNAEKLKNAIVVEWNTANDNEDGER